MAHTEKSEESFFDQLVRFLTGPKKALDKAANPVPSAAPGGDVMPVTGSYDETRKSVERAMQAKKLQDAAEAMKKPKKDPLAEALAMPKKKVK